MTGLKRATRPRPLAVAALLFAGLAALPVRAAPPLPDGYKVHQSIPLKRDRHGLDGALQMLEDVRVTPALRRDMWMTSRDPTVVLDDGARAKASFAATEIRPAQVRLVDTVRVLDTRTFEVPLAAFERERLSAGPRQPTFFVTFDETTGMGHSAVPATMLATVIDGTLRWEAARDAVSGKPREIILGRGLEADWRLDRRKDRTDILSVSCICANPDDADTYFRRYQRAGAGWILKEIQEHAAWTSDEAFPPARRFPKP